MSKRRSSRLDDFPDLPRKYSRGLSGQHFDSKYGESSSSIVSSSRKTTRSYVIDDDSGEFESKKILGSIESSIQKYSRDRAYGTDDNLENIAPIRRTSRISSQAGDENLENISSSRRSSRFLTKDDDLDNYSTTLAKRLSSRDDDFENYSSTRIKRLSSRDEDLDNSSIRKTSRLLSRDEDLDNFLTRRTSGLLSHYEELDNLSTRRASRLSNRDDDLESSLPPRTKRLASRDEGLDSVSATRPKRLSSRVSEERLDNSPGRLGKRFSRGYSEEEFESVGSKKLSTRLSSNEDEILGLNRFKRTDSRSSRASTTDDADASYQKTLEKIDSYRSQKSTSSFDRDEDSGYILPSRLRTSNEKVNHF